MTDKPPPPTFGELLMALFGNPTPPTSDEESIPGRPRPGPLVTLIRKSTQEFLETPQGRARLRKQLEDDPDLACCGDPECPTEQLIREIKATMPARPQPLSQDEADALIAAFEDHRLELPSDRALAAIRDQLGLAPDHPSEVWETADGPAVLFEGEVLVEYEPGNLISPWAVTAQGDGKTTMPTGLGLDPYAATARLIAAMGKRARIRRAPPPIKLGVPSWVEREAVELCWQEGGEAGRAGASHKDNPYPITNWQHPVWEDGRDPNPTF